MVFFWGRLGRSRSSAVSVAVRVVMVICFGTAPFLQLPEFMPLMARDRSRWPRCLLWHGWLPGRSTAGERDPWAASLGQVTERWLEHVLGALVYDSCFWTPPEFLDADDLAAEIREHLCVWTDGSRGSLSHGVLRLPVMMCIFLPLGVVLGGGGGVW